MIIMIIINKSDIIITNINQLNILYSLKNNPFVAALAMESCARNCSPASDLVCSNIIVQRVLFCVQGPPVLKITMRLQGWSS